MLFLRIVFLKFLVLMVLKIQNHACCLNGAFAWSHPHIGRHFDSPWQRLRFHWTECTLDETGGLIGHAARFVLRRDSFRVSLTRETAVCLAAIRPKPSQRPLSTTLPFACFHSKECPYREGWNREHWLVAKKSTTGRKRSWMFHMWVDFRFSVNVNFWWFGGIFDRLLFWRVLWFDFWSLCCLWFGQSITFVLFLGPCGWFECRSLVSVVCESVSLILNLRNFLFWLDFFWATFSAPFSLEPYSLAVVWSSRLVGDLSTWAPSWTSISSCAWARVVSAKICVTFMLLYSRESQLYWFVSKKWFFEWWDEPTRYFIKDKSGALVNGAMFVSVWWWWTTCGNEA